METLDPEGNQNSVGAITFVVDSAKACDKNTAQRRVRMGYVCWVSRKEH